MPPKIEDKAKMNEEIMGCFIAMCMRQKTSFIEEIRMLYNCRTSEDVTYDTMKGRLRPYNAIGREILDKAELNKVFAEGASAGKGTPKSKRKANGSGEGTPAKKKAAPKKKKDEEESDNDDV